jgi:hypothetical protein
LSNCWSRFVGVPSSVEAMRHSLFLPVLLMVCVCLSGPVCSSQQQTVGFHWDWHKIERANWETIGQSKSLSARARAALINLVVPLLRPFSVDMGIGSEQELLAAAAQTRINAVHLRANGVTDFLAQSGMELCSPTGNCQSWVFRHDDDEYSVILDRGATQAFTIQPTMTNGFHDLVLSQHGSATEQGLTLYRFNGSKYHAAACYEADWEIPGKDGQPIELREPHITPCSSR